MISDNSVTESNQNPLFKKLRKVLETRIENDPELIEGLTALSEVFTENNIRNRRNLRSEVEKRGLCIHEEFIGAFKLIKDELDNLHDIVAGMYSSCKDMNQRLHDAKSQTHNLIEKTTTLQAESCKLDIKTTVAEVFLERFQLTFDETRLLRANFDQPLTEDFFRALQRVRQIHNNCKLLLRSKNQTTGLEIMESMAIHMEAAYERLYRWTQNECRLQCQETPDLQSALCQALEALQDRPVLFTYSLEEYSTARRNTLVKGFVEALTRGGPAGTPRPMELHSHDPMRYTGDMLAWLHQAAASEREYLSTLLKRCNQSNLVEVTCENLNHITEGVCRPFKVRVEQVLIGEQDAVQLYRINSLLRFYCTTIGQMVTRESVLVRTVEEMQLLSWRLLFSVLNQSAQKMLENCEPPCQDLSPPGALLSTLQLLNQILTTQDAARVPLTARKDELRQVLVIMVDPLIQLCSVSASKLAPVEMAIYMVNCIHMVQSSLAALECTEHKLEMLQATLDAHMDTIVSEQASHILQVTTMMPVYAAAQLWHQHENSNECESRPSPAPLCNSESHLQPAAIKLAMSTFDKYLASPDSIVLTQMRNLQSARLRDQVKKRSADLVHSAYDLIYRALASPVNGYPDLRTLAPRTPDQVARLIL